MVSTVRLPNRIETFAGSTRLQTRTKLALALSRLPHLCYRLTGRGQQALRADFARPPWLWLLPESF